MSSVCRYSALLAALLIGLTAWAGDDALRVCSDPGNLPFSNMRQQGFENHMAQWLGRDLHRQVQFVWWPQKVRFVEKRLKAGQCDVVMGVPSGYDLMATSAPYYRSTYVFVSRRDRGFRLHSLHDPALHDLRIGLHVIGDEMEAVPPARELAANGMLKNIVGYSIYGRPLEENPEAELISAVADKDVDVALAWGPTAGYFAAKSAVPLQVQQICQPTRVTFWPIQFDISVGVRRGDDHLLKQVNEFLSAHREGIRMLLRKYHVPVVDGPAGGVCQ